VSAGVGSAVGVSVSVGMGVDVAVGVAVSAGVGVMVGVAVGVSEGAAVGVAVGSTPSMKLVADEVLLATTLSPATISCTWLVMPFSASAAVADGSTTIFNVAVTLIGRPASKVKVT